MIEYVNKDITTVERGIIVQGVNCLGLMGSGVALAIRNKWPKVYNEYRHFWSIFKNPKQELLGFSQTVEVSKFDELHVVNGFTQVTCGNDGKVYATLTAVEEVLQNTFAFADFKHLPIYLPRIGCGLGGLQWNDVEEILLELVDEYPHIPVTVCDI